MPTASNARFDIPDFINRVTFLASRPQSVQRDETVYGFFKKWEHLGIGVVTIPLEGNNRALYLERIALDQVYKELLEKVSTEQRFLAHLQEYEKLMVEYQDAITFFRSVDSQREHLKEAVDLFLRLTAREADFVWTPYPIEKILDPLFTTRLQNEFGKQSEAIREAVVSPTQLHEYQLMRLAICEAAIQSTDMAQVATELSQKYDWYGEYSYVEKLYDDEYFRLELGKLTPESASAEKTKILDEVQKNKDAFNEALAKITDPLTRHYAQVINKYVFLRTDRIDSYKKLQAPYRRVFGMIADALTTHTGEEWDMQEVVRMTDGEIVGYLNGTFVPDKKELAKRAEGYVYYRTPSTSKVTTDEEEMATIIDIVLSSTNQDASIKGMIAHKGVVTGRVALVFGKADLHKVTPGSVLVARTTMVDYISAMERAAAFVTEEGGVTSHAAIVARELKKPCIVGTGNCTRVLKDGDLVEVDAVTGIVRIITRANT